MKVKEKNRLKKRIFNWLTRQEIPIDKDMGLMLIEGYNTAILKMKRYIKKL